MERTCVFTNIITETLICFADIMQGYLNFCLPFENGQRPITSKEGVSLIEQIEDACEKIYDALLKAKDLLDSSGKGTKREYLLWQARTDDFLKLGSNREASIAIGHHKSLSSPDVRFVTYPRCTTATVLIAHTEVNGFCHKEKEKWEVGFDINELSPSILGQHGGELLAERHRSFFPPGVLGLICLKSKIIFTFLEINGDHYKCIKKGLDCSEKIASISYTKPCDYL